MKNGSFKLGLIAALFLAFSSMYACHSNTSDETTRDEAGTLDSAAASQLPDTTIMTDQPAAAGGAALPVQGDTTDVDSTTRNK